MTIDALNKNAKLVALAIEIRKMIEAAEADGWYDAGDDDEKLQGLVFGEEASLTGDN